MTHENTLRLLKKTNWPQKTNIDTDAIQKLSQILRDSAKENTHTRLPSPLDEMYSQVKLRLFFHFVKKDSLIGIAQPEWVFTFIVSVFEQTRPLLQSLHGDETNTEQLNTFYTQIADLPFLLLKRNYGCVRGKGKYIAAWISASVEFTKITREDLGIVAEQNCVSLLLSSTQNTHRWTSHIKKTAENEYEKLCTAHLGWNRLADAELFRVSFMQIINHVTAQYTLLGPEWNALKAGVLVTVQLALLKSLHQKIEFDVPLFIENKNDVSCLCCLAATSSKMALSLLELGEQLSFCELAEEPPVTDLFHASQMDLPGTVFNAAAENFATQSRSLLMKIALNYFRPIKAVLVPVLSRFHYERLAEKTRERTHLLSKETETFCDMFSDAAGLLQKSLSASAFKNITEMLVGLITDWILSEWLPKKPYCLRLALADLSRIHSALQEKTGCALLKLGEVCKLIGMDDSTLQRIKEKTKTEDMFEISSVLDSYGIAELSLDECEMVIDGSLL
ncbi:MAG: uncharacterized protein A8A55_2098 [Amphiamblys sp. WSBS2006]|nr:MAG: uncharacterized protein A8A55_2098 [Amphiamblys sp. WSBS2006]